VTSRSRRRPAVAAALAVLAAGHVADALAIRSRARRLAVLAPLDPDAGAGDVPALVPAVRESVQVPGGVWAAAAAHAAATDDRLVDLVPGDLPTERLLALLRRVDPAPEPGADGAPGGALHALALTPDLARQLGAPAGSDDGAGGWRAIDVRALARLTRRAQHGTDGERALVVVPELRATPTTPDNDWDELDAATELGRPYLSLPAAMTTAQLLHLAALGAGLVVAPLPAAAAFAAWWAKPLVALPAPARPADAVDAAARRPVARLASLVATARTGLERDRKAKAARAAAPPWPEPDTARFFEPRRSACPWCHSEDIATEVVVPDMLQNKAGRFPLDRCHACGHLFQNPMLTPAGLDYYYDQFYDGIGGELMTQLFAAGDVDNQRRIAAMVEAGVRPTRWLDVGTGHGHFPRVARERWPDATFDGLDLSDSVEDAARRGWVDTAYRGLFPDLTGQLAGYDVLSMHHYLEHTRDPAGELDAVAKVLPPGGIVEIEVPNPDSPLRKLLRSYWLPYLQPQHLHFVTCDNLVEALEARGFEIVSVQQDEHQGVELVGALAYAVEHAFPSGQMPWRPVPSRARQAARAAAITALLPVFPLAIAADQYIMRFLPRFGPANTFRVIARRT
jgi:ubiquinone/menaquinone biosynthesis C-methylase UbiE